MKLELDQLPEDPELLHQLVRDLVEQLRSARGDLAEQAGEIERLQIEVGRLMRRAGYGRKGERFVEGQQSLFEDTLKAALDEHADPASDQESADADADADDDSDGEDQDSPAKPKGRSRGRRKKDPKAPRKEVKHTSPEVEDGTCRCEKCGDALTQIGWAEGANQIEYIPAQFVLLDHKLAKYACKNSGCQGTIVTAPAPPQPIDRCLAAPGLLAHVIVSKYGDHLPLYRQVKMLARSGLDLTRQTLCGWMIAASVALTSIVRLMREEVLKSRVIQTDDVRIPVLNPGAGKTKSGYMWPYLGDEEHPHVVFEYTSSREGIGPQTFLADFAGYIQADAYAAYDKLFESDDRIEAGCMAHCRRKFHESLEDFPTEAGEFLDMVKALYAVERAARQLADDGERGPPLHEIRFTLRQKQSKPIIARMSAWLDLHHGRHRPTSSLHEATRYASNHWEALTRFVDEGALDIDNNRAERSLRSIVVGRKNWMFAGSDSGGQAAAVHYSLIASCALHGIDPLAYYRDILGKLHTHAPRELTPAAWAAANSPALAPVGPAPCPPASAQLSPEPAAV